MALTKAIVKNWSASQVPGEHEIEVLFNPSEYTIVRNVSYAEIAIPGLQMPLLQFVRGETQELQVELFLDRSETRESIADDLEALRELVRIDNELHAPPLARFSWSQTEFVGVTAGFRERFVLFGEDGAVQRARVSLSIKRFQAPDSQWEEIGYESPDRSKTWVVSEGDRLDQIAAREYGDPSRWPIIAEANGIERPRSLVPGTVLTIPAL